MERSRSRFGFELYRSCAELHRCKKLVCYERWAEETAYPLDSGLVEMSKEIAERLVKDGCDLLDRWKNDGTADDQQIYLTAKELFEQAALTDLESNRPLVLLSFMDYRAKGEGSAELLEISFNALRRGVNVDCVEYYFKSVFRVFESERDVWLIQQHFEKVKPLLVASVDAMTVFRIYEAIFQYRQMNFTRYAEMIRDLQSSKSTNTNIYLVRQILTSNGSNIIHPPATASETLKLNFRPVPTRCKTVSSVSCDRIYFEKYANSLFSSFARHSSEEDILHVGCVTLAHEEKEFLNAVDSLARTHEVADRVCASSLAIPDRVNIGPLAALARFIFGSEISTSSSTPIIAIDFDAAFLAPISNLVELLSSGDVGLRIRKGAAPWEKFTAGAVLINSTAGGRAFLGLVKSYALSVARTDVSQWWIDQNCLEAAWRHCVTNGPAVSFVDIEPLLPRVLMLPTGSEVVKKKALAQALAN